MKMPGRRSGILNLEIEPGCRVFSQPHRSMIVNPLMGGLEQIESIGSDIVACKQEMTSSIGASFGNATHPVVTGLKKLHCLVGHRLVRCAIENLPLNASESHKRKGRKKYHP